MSKIHIKKIKQDYASRVALAKTVVQNCTLPEIAQPLAEFGYDEAKFAEGQALVQAEAQLSLQKNFAQTAKFSAARALQAAKAAAQAAYMPHLTLARLAFQGDAPATSALGLAGPRPRLFPAWCATASQLYQNLLANPAYLARLATYGQTPAHLTAALALIQAAQAAQNAYAQAVGAARQATQDHLAALRALEAWVRTLRRIAVLALHGPNAQMLEAIGLVVPAQSA